MKLAFICLLVLAIAFSSAYCYESPFTLRKERQRDLFFRKLFWRTFSKDVGLMSNAPARNLRPTHHFEFTKEEWEQIKTGSAKKGESLDPHWLFDHYSCEESKDGSAICRPKPPARNLKPAHHFEFTKEQWEQIKTGSGKKGESIDLHWLADHSYSCEESKDGSAICRLKPPARNLKPAHHFEFTKEQWEQIKTGSGKKGESIDLHWLADMNYSCEESKDGSAICRLKPPARNLKPARHFEFTKEQWEAMKKRESERIRIGGTLDPHWLENRYNCETQKDGSTICRPKPPARNLLWERFYEGDVIPEGWYCVAVPDGSAMCRPITRRQRRLALFN